LVAGASLRLQYGATRASADGNSRYGRYERLAVAPKCESRDSHAFKLIDTGRGPFTQSGADQTAFLLVELVCAEVIPEKQDMRLLVLDGSEAAYFLARKRGDLEQILDMQHVALDGSLPAHRSLLGGADLDGDGIAELILRGEGPNEGKLEIWQLGMRGYSLIYSGRLIQKNLNPLCNKNEAMVEVHLGFSRLDRTWVRVSELARKAPCSELHPAEDEWVAGETYEVDLELPFHGECPNAELERGSAILVH